MEEREAVRELAAALGAAHETIALMTLVSAAARDRGYATAYDAVMAAPALTDQPKRRFKFWKAHNA